MRGGFGGLVGGLLVRSRQLKLGAVVVVLAILVAGVVGGIAGGEPSAEPTAQDFLLAWTDGQYRMAAALTTGAPSATVTSDLRTAYQQLGAAAFYLTMGPISQGQGTAQAYFGASVNLGQDGAPWNYRGHFTLRKTPAGWRVVWNPSVINPRLRPGLRLAVVTQVPARAPLLDAEGASLALPSPAYVAQVNPGRLDSPQATATAFAQVTGLDPDQVLSVIQAAPQDQAFTLVTLNPATYATMQAGLRRVPGVTLHRVTSTLFNSMANDVTGSVGTETSPVLQQEGISYRPGATVGLSGLQEVFQHRLAGSPETEIISENQAGHQVAVLARVDDSQAGTPVRTTINGSVQTAATSALAGQSAAAAIVAVSGSTGQILAVADQSVPGLPRVDPLAGRYQPGNAFTIVSTAALLSTQLPLDTPIPCTTSTIIGGQTFVNTPSQAALAQPPFSTDFAQSCGTAFAGLSRRLSASALTRTASSFGLGAGWKLPLTAFAGSVHASGTEAGLAADTIGQQGVQVSPLAMALVAAAVDSGTWRPPSLVTSPADPGLTPRVVAASQTVTALRQLMRSAVESGAANAANLAGRPVYGQVGVAPLSPGSSWWAHWFVGYRGDVAFAALVVTRSPADSAAPLGASFLAGFSGG